MSVKRGYFRLTAQHPTTKEDLRFEELYDDTIPNPVNGYALWEKIPRPHRRSATNWTGSEPLELQWGCIIDGFGPALIVEHSLRVSDKSTPVDDACRVLEIMAGLVGDGVEPPLVKIDSDGFIPHDVIHASQNRWVMLPPTWGDAIRDPETNARLRQQVTINMMEYVQDDVVQSLSAAGKQRAAAGKPGVRRKPYVVKKGDTLRKIAAKQLKNAKRWKEIAKLNNIRDPKNLKVGQHLKLPR